MQTKPFRIGTRGSPLALAQAYETRNRLMSAHGLPEDMFEIVVLSTKGDRITDRALSEIGGKGLFTEELESQLLSGELDIAVHSSKDMPTVLPKGLYLSAFLPREDMRDAFIGRTAPRLLELPQGAVVGSASLRRQALIRRLRPDLSVIIFRGQVETRLRKLEEGQADATLLAFAGLETAGHGERPDGHSRPEGFSASPRAGRDLRRESYWRHTHGRVALTYQRHTHLRCRYLRARLFGRPRWFLSHPDCRLCYLPR